MTQNKFGVLDAVGHAVLFAKANWKPAFGTLTLVAVTSFLTMASQYLGAPEISVLTGPVYYLAVLMAYGALYRRAFAAEHTDDPEFRAGPGGLQWRLPEWRLLGAGIYLIVVIAALMMAMFIAMLAIVLAAGGGPVLESLGPTASPEAVSQALLKALGPQNAALLTLVALVFVVLGTWLAVRLSLFQAAVVAEKRIVLFESMKLTKGRFWLVFASMVLVTLPTLAASVVTSATESVLGAPGAHGATVLPLAAAIAVSVLTALVIAYVQLPLTTGLYAELYRRLRARA